MTTARLPAVDAGPQLEHRMRRALAWYPGEWRAQHGEAMLSVLLDVAEAGGMPGPSIPQRLDLAAHGLVEWLLGAGTVRYRSIAANSAVFGASAFAVFHFVVFAWQPWVTFRNGFFDSPVAWPDLGWLTGAFLLVLGWRRVSKAVFAATAAGVLLMPLMLDPSASLADYSASVGGVAAAGWKTSAAVFLVAALFVLPGGITAPRRPVRTALAAIGAAAAMCALFCVSYVVTPLGIRGVPYAFELVFQTGGYGTGGWGEGYLWGRFDPLTQNAPVLVAVIAPLAIAAIGALRSSSLAARAVALLLPWFAFWAFHVVRDVLQNTREFILWSHGPNQLFTGDLRPLSAPAFWTLLAVFAAGCAAFAVLGVRAIARARVLAAAEPEAAPPSDQEPSYA